MYSSIFSSEAGAVATAREESSGALPVVSVIGLLALVAIGLELIGGIAFMRVSRVQRRINAQYEAAIRLQPLVDGRPTLLVAGNSLLLEGVDMPTLHREIGSAYLPSAFFVEGTEYVDWYYGLRRVFHAGGRPRLVLLGLTINQLLSNQVRGEYFARFLMDTRDFPEVVWQEKPDATTGSTWLFANLSGWIGGKTEIRKWVLLKTLRDFGEVADKLISRGPPPPDAATLARVAGPRLEALQALGAEYGARIVVVIPPAEETEMRDLEDAVQQLGKRSGVPVLVPLQAGQMPTEKYRDGYHLSTQGAKVFTEMLARQLVAGTP